HRWARTIGTRDRSRRPTRRYWMRSVDPTKPPPCESSSACVSRHPSRHRTRIDSPNPEDILAMRCRIAVQISRGFVERRISNGQIPSGAEKILPSIRPVTGLVWLGIIVSIAPLSRAAETEILCGHNAAGKIKVLTDFPQPLILPVS